MNMAAENNFMTPQNLSKIIKHMEEELGVTLFKRSKKGSDLTIAGERFYINIISVLKHYDDALLALSDTSEIGKVDNVLTDKEKIRVLCTQGVLSYAITEVYNSLKRKYNFILDENEISLYTAEDIASYMENKKYDIVACIIQKDDINKLDELLSEYMIMHVLFDEMTLIVGEGNFLSRRAVVSTSEICNLELISFKNNLLYDSILGEEVSCQIQMDSVPKALALIRKSDSYGILMCRAFFYLANKSFQNDDSIKMIRLDRKILGTYVILLRKTCVNNKLMMEFVMKIVEIFYEVDNIKTM